jgi:hypothetical protein
MAIIGCTRSKKRSVPFFEKVRTYLEKGTDLSEKRYGPFFGLFLSVFLGGDSELFFEAFGEIGGVGEAELIGYF